MIPLVYPHPTLPTPPVSCVYRIIPSSTFYGAQEDSEFPTSMPCKGEEPGESPPCSQKTDTTIYTSDCRDGGGTARLEEIFKAGPSGADSSPISTSSVSFSLSLSISLQSEFHQVGLDLSLVHSVQQVLGVHGQGVGGRQHLALALLAQRGDGVLLR